ncbi:hypothetical protein DL769_008591 [Monosporascus sp. CRB-8-3]|nr:hypothetical protein DL769_008591 [Monosporascus sp. CRB-8-3]
MRSVLRRPYPQGVRAAEDDWGYFVREVSARISLSACFKETGLLVCAAFSCDYVIHTDQEIRWRGAGDSLARVFGGLTRCASVSLTRLRWPHACWRRRTTNCSGSPSRQSVANPSATSRRYIAFQPGRLRHLRRVLRDRGRPTQGSELVQAQEGSPAGSHLDMQFQPTIPRYSMYMLDLLETTYTKDFGLLERSADEYAYILPCRRVTHFDAAPWLGWEQCTICPKYHYASVRGVRLGPAGHGAAAAGIGAVARRVARDAARPSRSWETSSRDVVGPSSSAYRYGVPGLGYGVRNQPEVAGAQYGAQAAAVGAGVGGAAWLEMETREGRWRAIEEGGWEAL